MKNPKTPEAILKEDIVEAVYLVLINSDLGSISSPKWFAKRLAKDIMSIVKERVDYFL